MTTHECLALDGLWQLTDTPQDVNTPAMLPAPDAAAWLPASVPGAVQQALLAAGHIPEPLDRKSVV